MLTKPNQISVKVIAIGVIMGFFGVANASELKVGVPAPDFELADQTDTRHSLNDYKGKWVVIYFYPKDDTPGCTKQACAFRDDIAILQSLNAQVFGVSVDDTHSHAKFAKKYSLQFPLLADTEGRVAKSYHALSKIGPLKLAKRHTFIIDPDGKIAKIYRSVKPASHSDEVIADIKQLQQQQ